MFLNPIPKNDIGIIEKRNVRMLVLINIFSIVPCNQNRRKRTENMNGGSVCVWGGGGVVLFIS